MFLSRFPFSRTSVLAGLVVASLLWAARPASAQQPLGAESKFDRANAGAALPGAYYAPWYAPPSVAPRPAARVLPRYAWTGPLLVSVKLPAPTAPVYVDLRGPNGEVQRFTVEGGPASIQTRDVIVRKGETATFSFAVANPLK